MRGYWVARAGEQRTATVCRVSRVTSREETLCAANPPSTTASCRRRGPDACVPQTLELRDRTHPQVNPGSLAVVTASFSVAASGRTRVHYYRQPTCRHQARFAVIFRADVVRPASSRKRVTDVGVVDTSAVGRTGPIRMTSFCQNWLHPAGRRCKPASNGVWTDPLLPQ